MAQIYKKLAGVMAEEGISAQDLAKRTGMVYITLTSKLRGDRRLYLDEAVEIKKALKTDMPLDQLFTR